MKISKLATVVVLFLVYTIGVSQNNQEAETSPEQLEKEIENGTTTVLFQGLGTEPFWDIYITATEVLYINRQMEIKTTYRMKSTFDATKQSQTLQFIDDEGKEQQIIIKKESGSDGMSDRTFPYSCKFADLGLGAGDSKKITDWSVYELDPNGGY